MSDEECVEFLRWALPRLGRRWAGYRRVRRQVCRRVRRRAAELGLSSLGAYRALLQRDSGEWLVLDTLANITISRFARDRGIWAMLERLVLPALVADVQRAGRPALRVWSAGCASGEEPYTLALLWHLALARDFSRVQMRILATDCDTVMLGRARLASYAPSSVKELPEAWCREAFVARGDELALRRAFKRTVTVAAHDLRTPPPDCGFDLVLCRNAAFTYFDEVVQHRVATRLVAAMRPGAALVLGAHETLPDVAGFEAWPDAPRIHRRTNTAVDAPAAPRTTP
jgi:chemotaxis protein methyltransferase CheR